MRRTIRDRYEGRALRRLAAIAVVTVVALAPLGMAAPSQGADPTCSAPAGYQVNTWEPESGTGDWDTPTSWSLNHTPGISSTSEVVCIRGTATVQMPAGAGIQTNAAALDLGSSAVLDIQRGNKLFVDGNPTVLTSITRAGSLIRLSGATLGGTGRLDLGGGLIWSSQTTGAATITSRNCSLSGAGDCAPDGRASRPGVMRVLAGGLLQVNSGAGALGVNLFDEYRIEVAGRLLVLGAGGYLAADHGTRLNVLGGGRLELRNDGGWLEGRDPFGLPLSVIDNDGTMAKTTATGTSVVYASFPSDLQGSTSVAAGTLALPGTARGPVLVSAGKVYASGHCVASAYGCVAQPTAGDPQTTRMTVPSADTNGAKVAMVEQPGSTSDIGAVVQVDVTGLYATRAKPAVLSLRYDASIRAGHTPLGTHVLRQHGTGSFARVPTCSSTGAIPSTATACVDRRSTSSRILSDGDLYLVIRTTGFSRWVAR